MVITAARARQPVLGIDPKLVMVVEIDLHQVRVNAEEQWLRSGLTVVDSSEDRHVVAFSRDSDLTEFRTKLSRYGLGPVAGQSSAYLEGFFDTILSVRAYGPQDRTGHRLSAAFDADRDESQPVTVDVELWYPGNLETAAEWINIVSGAIESADGVVTDTYVSDVAGLALLRTNAPLAVMRRLIEIDLVAEVETLPGPTPVSQAMSAMSVDDLGAIPFASGDTPVVGLIDSGVLPDHPLLRVAIVEAVTVSPHLPDGVDRHGHGTAVASLLIHGTLDRSLSSGQWEPPLCAVLSVRVLDRSLRLPDPLLAETELESALRYLARNGVRVVNVSLGDDEVVYGGGRAPRLAALLDSLARELQLVLVLPTGQIPPAAYYLPLDANMPDRYPRRMLDDAHTGLLDPAPAALALTVGGEVPVAAAANLSLAVLGEPGWPSPFGRRGPGIGNAIKPELSAPAGTLALDRGRLAPVRDEGLAIRVADGRPGTSGVISTELGTSLAAPLVTRMVGATEGRYPGASANLLRALALQSAVPSQVQLPDDGSLSEAKRAGRRRQLLGYGAPNLQKALYSDVRSIVLVAEDIIAIDDVHLYAVPIPSAFFASGRHRRGVTVSLAYDPPARARRLDYLGNKVQFDLIRGLPPQEVIDLFLAEVETIVSDGMGKLDTSSPSNAVTRVSALTPTQRLPLLPTRDARSRGANQLGRWSRSTALGRIPAFGNELLLVIQNINRWQPPGALQPYAIAVNVWVDDELPEIQEEIRQRVEAVRVQARADIRLQV